jgi:hypothetical protein
MTFASFENIIRSTGLFIDRLSFIKKLEDIFYFDSRATSSKTDVVPIKGLTDAGVFGSPAIVRSKQTENEREFEVS